MIFDQDLQICAGDLYNGGRDACLVSDNYMSWISKKINLCDLDFLNLMQIIFFHIGLKMAILENLIYFK